MIIGLGTDLVETARIKEAIANNSRFVGKLLTENELSTYTDILNEKRRVEFVAGRWAAKEAFAKAYGTGISSQLHFQDIEIVNNDQRKPLVICDKVDTPVHITISHTDHYATATVIIED
ncbi:4'-phosphopantetheinyl transferase [Aerococcus urinaeequi]|uniref:Holo-[acyl-carrier-protein] synthase n=1 Tax=Aerococcus urinaeequi TaxID=51665 RepID=A0AAC9A6Y2_9LACT|nr:holo-ACP synthase [Aerococcus urinaeequi]ALZ88492.1 4'-phosphopantetheinyl transferase [Aerococcus urinaeequi]AMB97729.1 4'-phosphopantetheinyl transferase [Aerococcus urinaeequi]